MGVSRATCARIMESAHKKVAAALTEGKAIRIEGGNVVLKLNRYRCMDCGTLWETEFAGDAEAGQTAVSCPDCSSARILDFARQAGWQPDGAWGRGRGGPGRGRLGQGGKGWRS
jgi:DNA-directed RNA polymerase subunit RPC12/RpoP